MAQGGGFCERHGPFDPPHRVCPYCVIEDEQRRLYGPPPEIAAPPAALVASKSLLQDAPAPEDEDSYTALAPQDEPEADESDAPATPLGWLVVKRPAGQRGTILTLAPNQSIGREGDIRWEDPGLSRQHARLTLEPPEGAPDAPPAYHLWPFAPTNPVFINGREIRGATPLRENDEIRLGNTLFVFKSLID